MIPGGESWSPGLPLGPGRGARGEGSRAQQQGLARKPGPVAMGGQGKGAGAGPLCSDNGGVGGARGHGNLLGGAAASLMNTMAGPGGGGGAMEGGRGQVTGRNGRESLGRKVYLWTGDGRFLGK